MLKPVARQGSPEQADKSCRKSEDPSTDQERRGFPLLQLHRSRPSQNALDKLRRSVLRATLFLGVFGLCAQNDFKLGSEIDLFKISKALGRTAAQRFISRLLHQKF